MLILTSSTSIRHTLATYSVQVPVKALEHDPDLFFRTILLAGRPADVFDYRLRGCL
jgi:hypothetical protein